MTATETNTNTPVIPRPFNDVRKDAVIYGVFDDTPHAEKAADEVAHQVVPESMRLPHTEIHEDQVDNKDLPVLATQAAMGPIYGAGFGLLATGLIVAVIAIGSRFFDMAVPEQAPLEAGFVLLAGPLFGALAGWLALSSHNSRSTRVLQEYVQRGDVVLTVHTKNDDDTASVYDILNRHGALATGRLA